jgi:hypothetical protein
MDSSFMLPVGGVMALTSDVPGVGCTGLALDICEQATRMGMLILYLDLWDAVFSNRLDGLSEMAMIQSRDLQSIRTMIQFGYRLSKAAGTQMLVVLDGLHLMQESLSVDINHFVASSLVKSCPGLTLLLADRHLKPSTAFDCFVRLVAGDNQREDDHSDAQLSGHILEVHGPQGTSSMFLEHITGRTSKAYEWARQQVDDGSKQMTSTFEWDGVRQQGFWKFVFAHIRQQERLRKQNETGSS